MKRTGETSAEDCLGMGEREILLEISGLIDEGLILHSPLARLDRANEFIQNQLSQLQNVVCDDERLKDLPELDLIIAIAGAISSNLHLGAALSTLVAAYIAKKGLAAFCTARNE